MTKLRILAAMAVFVALAPFARAEEAPTLPATPQAWRAAAESDLEALRMYIREDTPVALDTENARMQRWFDRGYREAQARTRRVRDQSSYFYALAAYTNGFQDPHLRLNPVAPLSTARWPGFFVGGQDTVVSNYGGDASVEIGTRVLSCDGKSLERLRERTVFPFVLNPQLASDRLIAHTRLFLDRGNTFAPAPRRCVVEYEGARRTITLAWRDVGEDYWPGYANVTTGTGAQWGVSTPTEGVTWIGVPSFANESATELRALVDAIKAKAETVRGGRAIVIDVRGNGGGNSAWGQEIANAVWGEAVVSAIPESNPGGAADWRVSRRNLDYINSFGPQLIQQFGEDSEMAQWVHNAQGNFEGALSRNEPFWREREPGETGAIPPSGGYTQRRPEGASPIPAHVYVLSNGSCASACLDFSDIVLHIPGTKLIGMDTSGDGLLMEVRDQALPSGLARVSLPLKVYRGRARGSLEAYHADVAYEGVWHDDQVSAWVMGLIAAQ